MGFHRSNSINSVTPLHTSFSSKTLNTEEDSFNENNKRFKNHLLYKMIWGFGSACYSPPPRRKKERIITGDDDDDDSGGESDNNLEQNKGWLLAESGGCGGGVLQNAEPQSVHSSFRFSVCSQVELETIKARTSCSPATVLMVNLENGMMDSPARDQLKWKRMVSIQKSISPLTKSLTRFTYGEILSASNNFSKGKVLGRGALSYVFRGRIGVLRTAVAIKRLDKEDRDSSNAFCRELMIASSLNNQHIVPLVGFCIEPDQGFFLVYQYVSGGNLEHYLHEKKRGVKGGNALPWSVRYKVAVGIAEAIGYLHNGTDRCILHRDIKPSNILLSSKKLAKLCDFGLATWTSAPSVPFLCKTVKGTFGYLAPEYFQHGKVSDKTDVYAFGVVLLELITGRRPIEAKRRPGEENLVEWAKPLLQQHCTEKLLDPRIKINRKNANKIANMFEAATACIKSEESQRPNAEEVIALLRGDKLPNCLSINIATCEKSYYAQLQPTKTDMESHIALAMLGVSEFEDDDQHINCR